MSTKSGADGAAALPALLAGSPGFLLNKAAQGVRERFEAALRPLGLKSPHYGVLALLAEAGPLSQRALGEALRIDRTTMVGVVDDLERLGFAARRPAPRDRRANEVHPTPAGERALRRARAAVAAVEAAYFAPLTADEREALGEMLRRLCR